MLTSLPSASSKRGFTLIELLVVVSIMVVITGVMLIRQSSFNSSTLLRSLSYSVALSVRQAQVYGTSVFGTSTSSGVVYASGYGVYFSSASPTSYILFADLNNNGTYDTGEDVRVYSLNNGYTLSNLCVTAAGAVQYCSSSGLSSLSVIYKRPNPDACFTTGGAGLLNQLGVCATGATAVYSAASVQVESAGDSSATRSINISSTGEISVNTTLGS